MERKDAARILYTEGFTQKEIAKMLGRSEKTISKWSASEDWKGKKVSFDLMKKSNAQRVLNLIDFQLRMIEIQTKQMEGRYEEEKNRLEKERKAIVKEFELGNIDELPPIDYPKVQIIQRGDIDALQKLHTTIRNEAKTWGDYVKVIKELLDFLGRSNIDLAQESKPLFDIFLNEKRKLL